MKILKRLIPILLLVQLLFLFCDSVAPFSTVQDGAISYECKDFSRKAFVSTYTHNVGDPMEILIPDKIEKYPVTSVGWDGPWSFVIQIAGEPGEYSIATSASTLDQVVPEYANIEYYDFDLYLGSNVRIICARDYVSVVYIFGANGRAPVVRVPRVYVQCDEDNRHFYSKNGRLYYKKDDTLVEGFIYHDQDVYPLTEQHS